MINFLQLFNSRKIIICIAFIMGVFHPLWTTIVQADENNKSVLDGYRENNRQSPVENATNEQTKKPDSSEQTPLSDTDELVQDQNLFGVFFKLFLALAVIIFMIYVLIRFIGNRSQSYQAHRTLQNIGGVHVGTNRSIQLVRVGNRVLVVGVAETIQLLKEINDQTEVDHILKDYEVQQGQQQLSSMYRWAKTKFTSAEENVQSDVYFKSLLERQLTDVKNSQKAAHAQIKEREQ